MNNILSLQRFRIGGADRSGDRRGIALQLVHKRYASQMYLTSWSAASASAFVLGVRWPRQHGFGPHTRRAQPLLVAETLRQASILISHVAFDVPMSSSFVMSRLAVRVGAGPLRGGLFDEVTATLTCREVRTVGGTLRGMVTDVELHHDGQVVATGSGTVSVVPQALYRRIRQGAGFVSCRPSAHPVPFTEVGCTSSRDVVLERASPDRYDLRVDTSHRIYFDHPLDHVPGMLILEAARQAFSERRGTSTQVLELESEFTSYAELTRRCEVVVRQADADPADGVLLISFEQDGVVVATVRVTPEDAGS